MYIDNPTRVCDQQQLDEPLSDHFLFTKSISDALTRNGIVTLRLLIMHSAPVLKDRIQALTHKDIEEIERKLAQAGWGLAKHADRRQVDLVMGLVTTLRAARLPLPLNQLVEDLRSFSAETWTEREVLQVLSGHPYFQGFAAETYRFSISGNDHEDHTLKLLEDSAEVARPVERPCSHTIYSPST